MANDRKQLLLDKNDIKLIFEENRDYIGRKSLFGLDSLIASIGFLLTIFLSDFKRLTWLKYLLGILAIVYLIWGVYNIVIYYKGKRFDRFILLEQLEDINLMNKHQHSIILIKDDFNKNSNRFLVYQDSRWDCKLFVNFHTLGNDEENIPSIEKHIEAELKSKPRTCEYLFDKTHSKYSVSAKREKYYHHKFYRLALTANKQIKQDSFTIDGKTFFWMSIAQMENDKNIMEKNSDIVGFVKEANI